MTDVSLAPGLVLVFGASGYIGTNLVQRLRQSHRPVRESARHRSVLEGRVMRGAIDWLVVPAIVVAGVIALRYVSVTLLIPGGSYLWNPKAD